MDGPIQNYIGWDLHKRYSYVTIRDPLGRKTEQRTIPNTEDNISTFLGTLQGKSKLAFEATYNWYWFSDLLEELGVEHVMAHPYKTKIIGESKVKTDKIDSDVLAQLLRADFLPTSYILDRESRDQREQLRYRIYLVSIQTAMKCKIQCILDKYNIVHGFKDLFCKGGLEFIRDVKLPPKTLEVLKGLLENLSRLKEEIAHIDKKITATAKEDEFACIVETIPGMGYYSALLLLKEIGDFCRFSNVGRIISFSGLIPSESSSGGKTYKKGITHQGNKYIRWVLVQAASAAIRSGKDRRLMRIYNRVKYKKNHAVAKVAVAKEILSIAYYLIKYKQRYNPHILHKGLPHERLIKRSRLGV